MYLQAWRHAFKYKIFVEYPRHENESHEALIGRAKHLGLKTAIATTTPRHRLMSAMCNLTSIINSVMKGSEEQLGEEDDLKARFTRLNLGGSGRSYGSRRSRRTGQPHYVRATFLKAIGGEAQRRVAQGPHNLYPGRHIQRRLEVGKQKKKKNFADMNSSSSYP